MAIDNRIVELKERLSLLKKGSKIHIKKANRGKFTDYCGGKVTSECIARGKQSPNPAIRKRATFAANVRSWKHQDGGTLKYQPGGNLIYNPLLNEDNSNNYLDKIDLIQNDKYPIEKVNAYKPMDLTWEPEKFSLEVNDYQNDEQNDYSENLKADNSNQDNLNIINNELINSGFKKIQRAAILATIIAESGANPNAIGDSGRAKGLLQWHGARFNAGMDLDSQIKLILNEIKDYNNINAWTASKKYSKKSAFDRFFNTEDLKEAINSITANYIRPANTDTAITKRFNIAQQLIKQMKL